MDPFYLSLMNWFLALMSVATGIYIYLTWNFNYFAKKNLLFLKPSSLFGNLGDSILQRKHITQVMNEIYRLDPASKFVGFFEFRNPVLILKDPELIKQVTIKEIDSFSDHRFSADEYADPMFGNSLICLKGQKWRDMRSTLSPSFTGNKIRTMYGFIHECADDFIKYISKKTRDGPAVLEIKEVFGRVTNDIFATYGFGVKVNSFEDKNSEFYNMAKALNENPLRQNLIVFGLSSFPNIMKNVSKFFRSLIQEILKTRKQEGTVHRDMIYLLMKARKRPASVYDENKELTNDEITAQVLNFLFGAFETVSTALSFAAYQLAVNPEVQRKLQKEIDEARKLNKTISYETMSGLKYLDMVVSETLRKHPPNAQIDRVCTKPFTFEDGKTKLKMTPGESLIIPVYSLHYDPKYFPNPDKFNPERFSDENKHKIRSGTYLPFGAGGRICIGTRLAITEMKVVLFHLLSKFNLKTCPKTDVPIIYSKKNFVLCAENGFWVEIEPRQML